MSFSPTPTVRSDRLGALPGLADSFPREQTLEIFRKTCENRYFELKVKAASEARLMKAPIYLSLGQEHISAALSTVLLNVMIFAQHRAHSTYLSFGGSMVALIDELLHRPTGCAGGMGGSASIQHHGEHVNMYGHSGLMGDQVPIAVGAALATGRTTLAIVGDASAEEDYVLGAMGYAATKKAPVLFVCEDNNLSILTPIETRRSWNVAEVARSFGMSAVDITDDPWLIAHHTRQLKDSLPAYMNVRTCRHLWHSGTGTDGDPEWNRFEHIKAELARLGLSGEAEVIESDARRLVENAWHERLHRQ